MNNQRGEGQSVVRKGKSVSALLLPVAAMRLPSTRRTLVLQRASRAEDGNVPILTCFFNPTPDDQLFKLPPPHLHLATRLLIDSAAPEHPERAIHGATLEVKARSVVVVRSVHKGEHR